MRNQHILDKVRTEKANEVKTFFHKLSTDPAMQQHETCKVDGHLADWLSLANYPLNAEISYSQGIYQDNTYHPIQDRSAKSINVALMMDMIFQNLGLQCNVNDLMKHINDGGTLEGFITAQDK